MNTYVDRVVSRLHPLGITLALILIALILIGAPPETVAQTQACPTETVRELNDKWDVEQLAAEKALAEVGKIGTRIDAARAAPTPATPPGVAKAKREVSAATSGLQTTQQDKAAAATDLAAHLSAKPDANALNQRVKDAEQRSAAGAKARAGVENVPEVTQIDDRMREIRRQIDAIAGAGEADKLIKDSGILFSVSGNMPAYRGVKDSRLAKSHSEGYGKLTVYSTKSYKDKRKAISDLLIEYGTLRDVKLPVAQREAADEKGNQADVEVLWTNERQYAAALARAQAAFNAGTQGWTQRRVVLENRISALTVVEQRWADKLATANTALADAKSKTPQTTVKQLEAQRDLLNAKADLHAANATSYQNQVASRRSLEQSFANSKAAIDAAAQAAGRAAAAKNRNQIQQCLAARRSVKAKIASVRDTVKKEQACWTTAGYQDLRARAERGWNKANRFKCSAVAKQDPGKQSPKAIEKGSLPEPASDEWDDEEFDGVDGPQVGYGMARDEEPGVEDEERFREAMESAGSRDEPAVDGFSLLESVIHGDPDEFVYGPDDGYRDWGAGQAEVEERPVLQTTERAPLEHGSSSSMTPDEYDEWRTRVAERASAARAESAARGRNALSEPEPSYGVTDFVSDVIGIKNTIDEAQGRSSVPTHSGPTADELVIRGAANSPYSVDPTDRSTSSAPRTTSPTSPTHTTRPVPSTGGSSAGGPGQGEFPVTDAGHVSNSRCSAFQSQWDAHLRRIQSLDSQLRNKSISDAESQRVGTAIRDENLRREELCNEMRAAGCPFC